MPQNFPAVAQLSAQELRDRLERGESLVVLDVREPDERALAAIPLPVTVEERHIPMGELVGRFAEIRDAAGARPVVVYCHHGVRSMTAAVWLSRQGVAGLLNLRGGIDAWSEIDPTVRRY